MDLDERPAPKLPAPPREYGPESLFASFAALTQDNVPMPSTTLGGYGGLGSPVRPRVLIDNSGSVDLTFPEIDLRPQHRAQLDVVQLALDSSDAGRELQATWYATATNAPGLPEGTLALRVESEPVPIAELIAKPKPTADAGAEADEAE